MKHPALSVVKSSAQQHPVQGRQHQGHLAVLVQKPLAGEQVLGHRPLPGQLQSNRLISGVDGGDGQLSGALAMIIGGAIVVGAAVYFKTGINWGSLAG